MEYFGLTDKGRVRPTNQDIFQIEAREDKPDRAPRRVRRHGRCKCGQRSQPLRRAEVLSSPRVTL